ncbi:LysR substrate-binding domain-containing protein [Cedecea colo]|uniref:LysR family transcriptional regulator n=1 Tax=Cedecea colo TaxID=2552946 RepID=A0ABX0VLF1_9ENTR|nr:LysR substrate-binding domain-containing protein [Cedecea colo]NIY47856.1 LysR family transcriptional regulator [Cedecea colo]
MVDTKKIKRHHLVAFVRIAELRKIRAAGKVLGLSQPSLSRTLKELETITGLPLVIRANDGVSLTDAGKHFFGHAKNILSAFDEMEEDLLSKHEADGISVGTGCSLNMLLPEVINSLCRHNITLNVCEEQTDILMQKLLERELDFCITTVSPHMTDPRFMTEELLKLRFGIFMSGNNPLRHSTSVRELHNQRWIMPPVRAGYHSVITDFLKANNMNPFIPVHINNMFGVPAILDKTDLLGILPVSFIENSGWNNKLAQMKVDFLLPMATYYLSYRKNEPLPMLAKQAITVIKTQIKELITDSYLDD